MPYFLTTVSFVMLGLVTDRGHSRLAKAATFAIGLILVFLLIKWSGTQRACNEDGCWPNP